MKNEKIETIEASLKEDILKRMEEIVDGCMGEETAACQATCPMHTNAKEYIRLIGEGKGEEAIKVIRNDLFIPATLGRICAHPCESKCKWNEGHSPMAIASLKRYAADNFDTEENWDLSKKAPTGKKVAVIGAGPSGMQAALELIREGHDVTIYEKDGVRGGMLSKGIPAYRLPRHILEHETTYLDKLGVKFEMNCQIGKDITMKQLDKENHAIVVAVGKQQGRVDRSIENWDSEGVFSAASFLREASLTSHVKNAGRSVLVIGGGDVAMDCARTAKRIKGVEHVYSICLEDSFDAMAASDHEIAGSISEGVKFNHAMAVKNIHVDEEKRIIGATLKKCVSMFDEDGRFAPKFDEDITSEVDIDTVVFAIGQGVDASFADGQLLQRGNSTFVCNHDTLQADENEKIFICGDASGESVIAVQAMATGRRAAESVNRYLAGKSLTDGRDIADTWTYETKLDMPTDWSQIEGKRLNMAELDPEERIKTFDEVYLGYTKEEAETEAQRCRQCECKLCMKECIMLNDFTECPKTLFTDYLENGIEKIDQMIAYSCNECSQCTLQCPNDFDMRSVFTELKSLYADENQGLVPLKQLQPSDETQIKESSEEFCITVPAAEKKKEEKPMKKKTKYVFAPGCSVSAYTPSGLENVVKHLKDSLGDENVGVMLQCCGKVTGFLGEDEKFQERNKIATDILDDMGAEVVITVCPSCFKVFNATCKNQKVISYWDLMHNLIGIPEEARGIGEGSDIVFNVHDSCVTRDQVTHHQSIRWMLDEMGYKWNEIEKSGTDTRCCGVGGMVCTSDPDLYERVYERRAKDFNSDNIVTYCGSCRGTMEAAGKDSVHILDLLFADSTYTKDQEKKRTPASDEEVWANRLETKNRFAKFAE